MSHAIPHQGSVDHHRMTIKSRWGMIGILAIDSRVVWQGGAIPLLSQAVDPNLSIPQYPAPLFNRAQHPQEWDKIPPKIHE